MSGIVSLYEFKGDTVSIYVTARFEDGNLLIEGQDIGKFVEESWGDSDYEYGTTVAKKDIKLLCEAIKINSQQEQKILLEIVARFKGDKCFSQFRDFLEKNKIDYNGFSYT